MKRINYLLPALLLVCVLLLSACSGGAVQLTYEQGAYQNQKENISYRIAPITYRAATVQNEEIIAKITGVKKEDIPLYAIEGMDSKLWLADADYTLYYNSTTKLPSLDEMQVNCITLCKSGAYTLGIATIDEAARITEVVELYQKGTTIPSEEIIGMPEARYELLFSSAVYSGFMYSLEYWTFTEDVEVFAKLTENGEIPDLYPGIRSEIRNGEAVFHLGKNLVFDRANQRCYAVGDLLDNYFTIG